MADHKVIIAIDPSINHTGYAVYVNGELDTSGVIRTPDLPDPQRVAHVTQKVWSIAVKYPAVALVIEVPESFSYARSQRNGKALNQGSMQKLNWVIGGLYVLPSIWGNARPMYTVSPRQWKGKMDKKLSKMITGVQSHDESDAILLGQWFCRIGKSLLEAQW